MSNKVKIIVVGSDRGFFISNSDEPLDQSDTLDFLESMLMYSTGYVFSFTERKLGEEVYYDLSVTDSQHLPLDAGEIEDLFDELSEIAMAEWLDFEELDPDEVIRVEAGE